MWQILKADLGYARCALMYGYGISLLVAIASFIWDIGGVYSVMPNSLTVYFITVAIIGLEEIKEKRDRRDWLLPLSIREIGVGRMLLVTFFQLAMFLMWLVVWIFQHDGYVIWSMLSTNAIIFIGIAILTVYHDLGFFGTKKYYWRMHCILGALYVLAGLMVYVKSWRAVFEFTRQFYSSPPGALLLNSIALGLFVLSVNIYIRRKSFLA